ncbi:MAG TPA: pirin family protein [Armatimonadota bacterium]|jgi:hypothetical protein
MVTRRVAMVIEPQIEREADHLTIGRMIGGSRMVLLDPFLLLDHMVLSPEATEPEGFKRHPHRGIETLTYVFEGQVHHKDSLGNDSRVGAGGSQWMSAAGGIFHEEYLEPLPEGNNSLQIWFNLPTAERMKAARYQAVPGEAAPVVALEGGASARVIAGELQGREGALKGIAVRPAYLDVALPAGASALLPAPEGESTFAFLYRGEVAFEESGIPIGGTPRLVVFSEQGDGVWALASNTGEARFVFVSARPLREPVLQYRTLVTDSTEAMRQALEELEQGTFERQRNDG